MATLSMTIGNNVINGSPSYVLAMANGTGPELQGVSVSPGATISGHYLKVTTKGYAAIFVPSATYATLLANLNAGTTKISVTVSLTGTVTGFTSNPVLAATG